MSERIVQIITNKPKSTASTSKSMEANSTMVPKPFSPFVSPFVPILTHTTQTSNTANETKTKVKDTEESLLIAKANLVIQNHKKYSGIVMKIKEFIRQNELKLTQVDRTLVNDYCERNELALKECQLEANQIRATLTPYLQGKQALVQLMEQCGWTDAEALQTKLYKEIQDFQHILDVLQFI